MEAKELRIGNKLQKDNGEIFTVLRLDNTDDILVEEQRGLLTLGYNLFGIPVTEEWHNKFGAKKNGFNNFEYRIDHNKVVLFSGDYVFLREENDNGKSFEDDVVTLWNNDTKKRSIKLHEWQTLYFALTGGELEIK